MIKRQRSNPRTAWSIKNGNIKQKELNKIVRYKIFINDITTFTSYSCNWTPGKGLSPYIKKEKFSEFEKS